MASQELLGNTVGDNVELELCVGAKVAFVAFCTGDTVGDRGNVGRDVGDTVGARVFMRGPQSEQSVPQTHTA